MSRAAEPSALRQGRTTSTGGFGALRHRRRLAGNEPIITTAPTGEPEDDEVSGFDAFFRAESGKLVGQAYLLLGELQAAQDLAQQVLETTWRNWARIRHYDRPSAWSSRVLLNLALNERRRWGRERPLIDADSPPEPAEEPAVFFVDSLRSLPVEQRQAIVMYHAMGFPVAEIARALGAPEGTVKSWLSRARAQLASELRSQQRGEQR